MNENRDMFYGGYGGTLPNGALMNQAFPPSINPNMPGTFMPNQTPMYSDNLSSRINNIEQTLRRLEYRISRLENPSGTTSNSYNINNEPDGNLYML